MLQTPINRDFSRVVSLLPWQTNSTFIIIFQSLSYPIKALFFRSFMIFFICLSHVQNVPYFSISVRANGAKHGAKGMLWHRQYFSGVSGIFCIKSAYTDRSFLTSSFASSRFQRRFSEYHM